MLGSLSGMLSRCLIKRWDMRDSIGGSFSAMAENKAGNKNQVYYMKIYAVS